MLTIGRVCVKIAGRDAGKKCVIVDTKDNRYEVDGQTRRRFVNGAHLEPTAETLDVKKGASHADVAKAFKALGVECAQTKAKKVADKPKKVRKAKAKPEAKPKAAKAEKKEAPKEEKPKAEAKAEKAEKPAKAE